MDPFGETEEEMAIAFDTERRRPGCVLIQVGLGGTVPRDLFNKFFPAETWLVGMGNHMKLYKVTKEQLPELSAMALKAAEDCR